MSGEGQSIAKIEYSAKPAQIDYSAKPARNWLLSLDYVLQDGLAFRRTLHSRGCMRVMIFPIEFLWVSLIELIAGLMTAIAVIGLYIKWAVDLKEHLSRDDEY